MIMHIKLPHLKRLLTLIFILSTLLSCATVSEESKLKEAESHYKLAISHMEEGEYQPAFVELQKALKINPGDKYVYYALGIIYHYFGDISKSEESLKNAIAIDPEYSEALNMLGIVYMKTGRWDSAIESFKRALGNTLYAHPEKAFANLGLAYYRKGNLKEAIRAFKSSLKRMPDFHVAYYGLALCYNAMDRYGAASEALNEAIKYDPEIKGDRNRAREVLLKKKLGTTDRREERDYRDFIEILHY